MVDHADAISSEKVSPCQFLVMQAERRTGALLRKRDFHVKNRKVDAAF